MTEKVTDTGSFATDETGNLLDGDVAQEETPEEEVQETKPAQAEQTEETTPAQEPAWKSRYATPDKMWEHQKELQSELDKTRDELKRRGVQAQEPTMPDPQTRLAEFARDPDAFLAKQIGDIRARTVLQDYLEDHPDFRPIKSKVLGLVNNQLEVLANPQITDLLFKAAMYEDLNNKAADAAQKVRGYKEDVVGIKKQASLESSSAKVSQPEPLEVTPGMSVKESREVLKKRGLWKD